MLLKINHIKNVGRFYEVVPKGSPESSCSFEQFGLLYADNGTGKTTLGSIIKSLAYNDPQRILTRKTIPGDRACEVSLQFETAQCNFLNEVWNKLPDAKFAIFDEEFIEKNIFSTTGVDTNHKRQLFNYVILGEENVDKARELQSLVDAKIPAITKEITAIESQLKLDSGVADIKNLLDAKALPPEDFEKLKTNTSAKFIQINNSENIKTHKVLNKLTDMVWPEYAAILAKGLDEIGNIGAYRAHINNHQDWIKDGLAIQKNENKCPYCLQDITGNEAVMAYQQFFSNQCQALIAQVISLSAEVATNLSHDKALLVEKTVDANKDCCVFWQAMDKTIPAILFVEQYAIKIKDYREALLRLIDHKQKNILESIQLTEIEEPCLKIAAELSSAVTIYNNAVDEINLKIAELKAQHVNLDTLKQEYTKNVVMLKCQQVAFHNEDTKKFIERYKLLSHDKQILTERLNVLRTEINNSSLELLNDYQASINQLLKSFGVEFRINKVERKVDTARKDSLVFNIDLKGMVFDPSGSRNIPYSLSNTLSSGDKSTLAFALFMARLQHADLSNTIIVFDDPISSLDYFRKQQTSKQISAITKKAKQVIVLTHSMEFTKLFGHMPVKSKYFKLFKADSMAGVALIPYDKLSDMCVSKHNEEHEILITYLSTPALVKRLDVLKSIRSYVETKLCIYLPELATLRPPTLGNFIQHLRDKKIEQSYMDELELINDSIVIENHGGDPIADDHNNLTDDELRNLCRLALELTAPPI